MAVVDFTLEDVRQLVVSEVHGLHEVVVKDVTKIVEDRFQLFEAKYDDDTLAIQQDLTVIIKRLEVVEHGLGTTRRIVDKHSKDIMHLRAIVEG